MDELGELLTFTSHEDITSRPRWRDGLDPRQHRLARILGDYHFPKNLEWPCGLSTCRRVHQKGFVVQAEGGQETHIGKDCGAHHFHLVSWEAEHARYRRDKADAELHQYLKSALAETASLTTQAQEQYRALGELLPQLREVLERLARDPDLQHVFLEALRAGGAIRKTVTLSKDEAESRGLPPGRRTVSETLAQLDGTGAVQLDSRVGAPLGSSLPTANLCGQLRQLLSSTIPGLTQERLAKARPKERKAIAEELRKTRETIVRAASCAEDARRFLAPANLHKLHLLDLRRVSGRAAKVLSYFARLGQPAGPEH